MAHASSPAAVLAATIAVAGAWLSLPAAAADPAPAPARRLYPQPILNQAARVYGETARALWAELLARVPEPYGPAAQRVTLVTPMSGPTPLAFWSQDGVIFAPAESLKFLDDLLIALRRKESAGCDAATVHDYVAMLAAGKLAKTPMGALGVTASAEDVGGDAFKSALAFVLAHELGHVLLGHARAPKTVAEASRWEREADAFALEALALRGLVPTGAVAYLTAVSSWEASSSGGVAAGASAAASPFPLGAERLRALSRGLDGRRADFAQKDAVTAFVREVDALAALLEDSSRRDRTTQRALARSEPSLRDCAAVTGSGGF